MGENELNRVLRKLDGDREASPLLVVRERLIASHLEAEQAIREARGALESMVQESGALSQRIQVLEAEIVTLAGSRSQSSAPATHTANERQDLSELRERLASSISKARRAVSAAQDVRPGVPASKSPLQPGFAAAVLRSDGRGSPEEPDSTGLLPTWKPGVVNARGTAQAMMAQAERARLRQTVRAARRRPSDNTGSRESPELSDHELEEAPR